ncbi:hypothetical protein HA402_005471 [Bradysia odoriphaga]|nr:hypothetical protein HA402_005471 [Bradysia odoriphaga]
MFVIQKVYAFFKILLEYITLEKSESNYSKLKTNDDKTLTDSAWTERWRRLQILLTFFWPDASRGIQVRILLCILIVIAESSTSIFVPVYNQRIVDSIDKKVFCWDLILIYVGLQFLSMGPLWAVRSFLWQHVHNFINRNVETKFFAHLHRLSLRWHLSRRSGEILELMNSASYSISSLASYCLFSFGPAILDILTSVVFLTATFNWYFGLLITITLVLYLRIRIYVTNWAQTFEKKLQVKEKSAVGVDSLLNIETIKYCGTTKYEVEAYANALLEDQKVLFTAEIAFHVTNLFENVVVCGSLLVSSLLCAYLVVDTGSLTSGQYVFFAAYMLQLYSPMNRLSGIYRHFQDLFIDMGKLYDILNEKPEVVDAHDAIEFSKPRGDIIFSHVCFSYDPDREILNDVSFSVAAGKTVALVGPSGSGKSTIIRLLSRFYDVGSGSISIDGVDVKKMTQESLHAVLGIVPQDTILFNKTIKYNIKYGQLDATDDEVESAARAADIHDNILNFPDKYETEVGDRGLRLSGGEKQRVAIARTILKAPPIVLLDEATSALDTQTERNIQSAIAQVCQNRTTIIVAHRLSTIIHADEILVLKEGRIIERGRHEALLQKGGTYAEMWQKQFNDEIHEKQD